MTALQQAALAGAMLALGMALLTRHLLPIEPDLAAALDRLSPQRSLESGVVTRLPSTTADRVGYWALRRLPLRTRPQLARDLELLGVPLHRHYGQKLLYGVFGLVFPLLLTVAVALIGMRPPPAVPALAALLTAGLLSLIPEHNARTEAAAARTEFVRALGAYIDLVALERLSGAGPRQAMESAAQIGDSWPFHRIGEELARSRWSGEAPWDALGRLATHLALDDLADLSDIMRLSGEQGSAVYQTLRARSASIRSALVTDELAAANRSAERLTLPGAVLALTFAITLTTPAMFRLLAA